MHIRFAEADKNFIISQAADGFYANETEVVRDAVRRLREQREAQQSSFYKAVMKGHEQIEQGLTTPLTRELMRELREGATARAKNAKNVAFDPDAIAPENDR